MIYLTSKKTGRSFFRKMVFFAALLFSAVALQAQQITVSGVVTDTAGEPIIGAYVLIPGTQSGTSTDVDGRYSLSVASNGTLEFRALGYSNLTVNVSGRMVINVTMEADAFLLEETVVVGYGVLRKRDITSSISQIKGEDLANRASSSFMQNLAGKASGVQVITASGDLGTPPTIVIRGVNTISSSSSPLYVVNGVPITAGNLAGGYSNNNALADINPSDIESFEILKDGAATAIYGSRAANGVVLITTKQGKQGEAKVTYDGWIAFARASKLYDLLNAREFVEIANERNTNKNSSPQAFMDANNTDTDWFAAMYRTGVQHNHALSVTGGTDKTTYYMSGGYSDQQGVLISNSYKRFTAYSKVDRKILNNYAAFGISLNASYQKNTGQIKGTNSLSDNMFAGTRMLPNVPIYNENDPTGYNIDAGDRKSLGRGANTRVIESSIPNIIWVLNNNKNYNDSWRLLPTAYLDIKPTSWLSFRTQLGADLSLVDDIYSWHPDSGDGAGYKGLISNTFRRRERWNFQNVLTFNKDFDKHHVDATAVAEWTKYTSKSFSGGARDISDPFFIDYIISNSYGTQSSGGNYDHNGLASYIFRANYNWNRLLYIGGSIRYDGLSRLPVDNRWGTFYGVSGAFRISNMDFWKNSSIGEVISDFKFRGSYAEVGNDDIGSFPYVDSFGTEKYGENNAIAYSQVGNPNLQWEKQNIMDIGFDATLFKRIDVVFSYWQKNNTGIVLNVPTPPSLGVPSNRIAQNFGKIDNNGIEVEISGMVINKADFSWRASFNIATQKSIVKQLNAEIPSEWYVYREGESLRSIWGYQYEGVNLANGFPMYRKGNGDIIQGNPSDSKYYIYDPNNPGTLGATANLNPDMDRVILGPSIPTWFGGLDNTFTYKNFDLNLFFRFAGGNVIANATQRDLMTQTFQNNSKEILNRWKSPTEPGNGQVPIGWASGNAIINLDSQGSSRWVEKGDFLKLQNISLGYNLPSHLAKKLTLEKIRVYIQAQNMLTITKYSGLDPETYTTALGIDWNGNPQQKMITLGINIGF